MPEPARTAAAYPRSVLAGIGAHVGDLDLGVFDPGQEEIVTPALSGEPEVGATR